MGLFKKSDLLSAITNRATKKNPAYSDGTFQKSDLLSAIRNRATKKNPAISDGTFQKKKNDLMNLTANGKIY